MAKESARMNTLLETLTELRETASTNRSPCRDSVSNIQGVSSAITLTPSTTVMADSRQRSSHIRKLTRIEHYVKSINTKLDELIHSNAYHGGPARQQFQAAEVPESIPVMRKYACPFVE